MENVLTESTSRSDKKLVASGIFWNFVQLLINQSFAFVLKLILAKLLFPSQFGLVGMATIFTGFVQVLNDLGVGAAIIQRKDADLRKAHYHTAFWIGVIWSVVLYTVMSLAIGPIAADFYHQPALKMIIPVLSIGILVSPVNLVHRAQLVKKMNFRKLAVIDNTSNIISGIVALIIALMGGGIWALVFNAVASIFIAMPLFFKATGWKPAFVFEKEAFKDVFGFGAYTTGSNILNYLYNNIDYLLIGKLLGATSLGVYTLAFVLTDTFRGRLMSVINNVMYPIYGKKQDDIASLKKYYLKVVLFNCLIIFPVMIFFVMEGKAFILGVFGSKWLQTVAPLQILSFSVMFHVMVSGNTALLRGLGRPGLEMKQQVIKALIFLPSLAFGIFYYGLVGAAWAILINKIVGFLIAQYTFNYLIPVKISIQEFAIALKAPIFASVAALIITYLLSLVHVNYLIAGTALCLSYAAIIWFVMGNELKTILQGFRKANHRITA